MVGFALVLGDVIGKKVEPADVRERLYKFVRTLWDLRGNRVRANVVGFTIVVPRDDSIVC